MNTCTSAAANMGLLSVLRNVPWDSDTSIRPIHERWDCLQYAVDNKAPNWETYAKRHASTSDEMTLIRSTIC